MPVMIERHHVEVNEGLEYETEVLLIGSESTLSKQHNLSITIDGFLVPQKPRCHPGQFPLIRTPHTKHHQDSIL
ncbi:unnamed protein product [Coregonus sp. 'balchen']|nr:unnamed protein product [Coregonus sp. 'balchen']